MNTTLYTGGKSDHHLFVKRVKHTKKLKTTALKHCWNHQKTVKLLILWNKYKFTW